MNRKYFTKEQNYIKIMVIKAEILLFLGHNQYKIDRYSIFQPVGHAGKTTISSKISHKIFDITPFFDYILQT